MEWELIETNKAEKYDMYRAWIPTGWLIKCCDFNQIAPVVRIESIHDPQHKWQTKEND